MERGPRGQMDFLALRFRSVVQGCHIIVREGVIRNTHAHLQRYTWKSSERAKSYGGISAFTKT